MTKFNSVSEFREYMDSLVSSAEDKVETPAPVEEEKPAVEDAPEPEQEQEVEPVETEEQPEGEEEAPAEQEAEPERLDVDKPKVPLKRLNRVLDDNKRLEQELIETRTKFNLLVDAVQENQRRATAPAQQAEEQNPFDADTQPAEYFRYENQKLQNEINQVKSLVVGQQRQQQAVTEVQRLGQTAGRAIDDAIKSGDAPDAKDAFNYLMKAKAEEFKSLADSEQEAMQMLDTYLMATTKKALNAKRDLVSVYKNAATALGYTPQKAAAVGTKPNLAAIEKNRAKSSNVMNGSGAQPKISGGSIDVKHAIGDNGRIDPSKFREIIGNIRKL
jgi:chemotaxis protein histidine kinase CheA